MDKGRGQKEKGWCSEEIPSEWPMIEKKFALKAKCNGRARFVNCPQIVKSHNMAD